MTLAPSEKHLEDWIANNFREFKRKAHGTYGYIISRQPEFPSGKPDLIVRMMECLAVIELKLNVVDEKAVGQCLRYMGDIQLLHADLYGDLDSGDNPHAHSFGDNLIGGKIGRNPIHGILIGHSYTNAALHLIKSFRLEALTYDFDESLNTFDFNWPDDAIPLTETLRGSDMEIEVKKLMRHLKLWREDIETLKTVFTEAGFYE